MEIIWWSLFVSFALLSLYRIIVLRNHKGSLLVVSNGHKVVSAGGIVMLPLFLYFGFTEDLSWHYVVVAMMVVGFVDDKIGLSVGIRLFLYLLAVAVVLYFSGWVVDGWFIFVFLCIFYLFWVNAVNFMDGINGMVVLQSLVILLGLLWSNIWDGGGGPIFLVIGFLIAFAFFNLRKSASLYLGDAGSIGLGFLLGSLLLGKHDGLINWHFLIFVTVFVVDVSATLLLRLWRGDNVFERHQTHLYQRLVYELGWLEVKVSIIYGLIQAVLIVVWRLWLCELSKPLIVVLEVYGCMYLVYFIIWRYLRLVVQRNS
jgi:UDP-GlcNAc:undecaprenyl-phosphate/decaprenyl-phosphate GlcNAc-1-phosphate transferase